MMPKANLRDAISSLAELTEGTFQLVMDDPNNPARERVRRIIVCGGENIFRAGIGAAKSRHRGCGDRAGGAALSVSAEGIAGDPVEIPQRAAKCAGCRRSRKIAAAWIFMSDRLEPMLPETAVLTYAGREESASPAVGSYIVSKEEEVEIVQRALELPAESQVAPAPVMPEATVTAGLEPAKATPGPGMGAD